MNNNNWIFGNNCGLDFSAAPAPPIPTSGFAISTLEGCASVSDSNGSLLLYTDGSTVWDSNNTVRASGLLGNSSSTQSAIIVPDPGNDNQYYIFTADGASGSNNHFNGGLINVNTWVFTPLSSLMTLPSTTGFSPVEKITVIQHENCKDFWVITILQKGAINDGRGDGTLRVFEVNSSGIQHAGDTFLNQSIIDYGYMKASPDGQKLAIANYGVNEILIFPFNKSTGIVNVAGLTSITTSTNNTYGLEFSPNSSILYYSDVFAGPIYQVDLTGSLASTVVGSISGNTGALQLGIDNRIYIAKASQSSLAAIQDPDVVGTGCNVSASFITLPSGSVSQYGLPNLISSFCTQECDCGCTGCDKDSEEQNEELIERAKKKYNTEQSDEDCPKPFAESCELRVIEKVRDLSPCFSFHWGDGKTDRIEEHDTEVFYLTVCNKYNDITYNGLRIKKVSLTPDIHPLEKIQIVPDRFINLDCLEPCSCQTREFTMITRANDTAGDYTLEVEYCFEEIVMTDSGSSGVIKFPVTITKD